VTTPRVLVVAARVLRQLRRDKRTLALIVLQPLLIMGVFGYAFGGDVTGARLAVANLDRGDIGQKVVARLHANDTVALVEVGTEDAARDALARGDVAMAIVIPTNYTSNFESPNPDNHTVALLRVYDDKTNPTVTAAQLAAVGDAIRLALQDETGRRATFAIEEHAVYGQEEGDFLAFFVPGIAAFAIFQLGSLLTVVTIVKERTLGTLPRLMASPVRRWEVVLGYTGAFTLLSLVQATSIIALATLVFQVRMQGSVLLALGVTTLVGIVALGFGVLVSGLARTEFQAVQAVFLVSFPNMFLAGIFSPIEAMPPFVRPVTRFVPLSYAVDALRQTINHGRGLAAIAPDLLVLAAFALGFLLLATFSFARKT